MTRWSSKQFWNGVGILILIICSLSAWAADDSIMLDSARARLDSGDLAGATALANDLLRQFPASPKAPSAQLMVARIQYKNTPDATGDLLSAFSLVRMKYPASPEAADALVHIGFLHSRSNTADSIKDFESFLVTYPNHTESARVAQTLGRLYLRTHDLDKAEAAFDKLKGIQTATTVVAEEAALQSGFVKIMKFHADKKREHLAAAITSLSAMSSADGVNVRSRADLGVAECLLLLGKSTEAREKYSAAVRAYADQPYTKGIALYGMACCSQMTGNYEAAVKDYATFIAAQTGAKLADKVQSWKTVALASTTANMQALVQREGSWGRVQGSGIVQESAYHQARCLYSLGRRDDAIAGLPELISTLKEGSELRADAEKLLERCRNSVRGEK